MVWTNSHSGINTAVLATVPDFSLPAPFFFDRFPHGGIELPVMLAGCEHSGIFAERFFLAVSRNVSESPVDHDNIAARIQQHDRFAAL